MDRLRSRPFTHAAVFLLLCGLTWPAALKAQDSGQPTSAPTLLLDPDYLADSIHPGPIFTKLGDIEVLWVGEIEDQGTPGHVIDDTVRIGLWGSDGTSGGTRSLLPPELSLYDYYPETLDDVLVFAACRPREPISILGPLCSEFEELELWRTDGTPGGTYRLFGGAGTTLERSSNVLALVPELGKFFFVGGSEDTGPELWASDGSKQGTKLVTNLADRDVFYSKELVAWDGELYFAAYKRVDENLDLWIGRSDGTKEGTVLFRANVGDYKGIQGLAPAGDHLFLVGYGFKKVPAPGTLPGTEVQAFPLALWAAKRGTEEFTQLADLGYDDPHSIWYALTQAAGDRLFFDIDPYGANPQVWTSDGTASGTFLLGSEGGDGAAAGLPVWTEPSALPGGKFFLRLWTEEQGFEPWVSDGTSAGITSLGDLCPGWCDSWPVGQMVLHGWYYFTAKSPAHGWELWRWRPASGRVEMVADLCPGECSGSLSLADRVGDRFFFVGPDDDFRWHVWELLPDGMSFREVARFGDLRFGAGGPLSQGTTRSWKVVGDRALFWARDPENHIGLWSMPLPSAEALPPPGAPLVTEELPGFTVKVRISPSSAEAIPGRAESDCIPETLCVSGAVPGRSEVFVRVVGPKPNGKLWPTLVKFSTSEVEAWIEQLYTGIVRYYRLDGASPGSSELPGLFDRGGFPPTPDLLTPAHESGL